MGSGQQAVGSGQQAVGSEQQAVGSEQQEETDSPPTAYRHLPTIKDPRELRMIDPACGSMHFGLYAFDLYECIYEEAWDLQVLAGSGHPEYVEDSMQVEKNLPPTVYCLLKARMREMGVRNYQDLLVWQRAMNLVDEIYQVTKQFPKEEMFGLTS